MRLALKGGQDIVLMDLQMPGMDGHAACAALRRHEAERGLPRLPVVAMTAHLLNEERRRMHASGMDGYISKPFEWSTLVAEINRVLASDADDNGFPPDAVLTARPKAEPTSPIGLSPPAPRPWPRPCAPHCCC